MSTIPKTRQDLLNLTGKAYASLTKLLDQHGSELGTVVCDDDWTVRDLLAVRLWWLKSVAEWVEAGRRGEVPATPSERYGWNETPLLNNEIVKRSTAVRFDEIRSELELAHQNLLVLIESLDDRELLTPGVFEWAGEKWPVARWISVASARQFTSAAAMIRKAVRRSASGS